VTKFIDIATKVMALFGAFCASFLGAAVYYDIQSSGRKLQMRFAFNKGVDHFNDGSESTPAPTRIILEPQSYVGRTFTVHLRSGDGMFIVHSYDGHKFTLMPTILPDNEFDAEQSVLCLRPSELVEHGTLH
jgi:hypothetical protein